MRILFVSDVFFPRVNGVSTSIHTFREDLQRLGLQSLLIAPDYAGQLSDAARAAERGGALPVQRIPSAGVPGDPEDRRMRWGPLMRALDAIGPRDFDLVHIHTPFVAHYAGVRFARRTGIPAIATYHTFFQEYLHHYVPVLPRGIGRTLARHFTRSQCAQVAALISPSRPMQDVLNEYGVATLVHVIPTGLPAERFQPGDGARFRARFGLAATQPLLLFVGRIAHEKNIGFLLEMFALLRRSRADARFVIAGEGPASAALQAQAAKLGIAEHVTFVGNLDREQGLADCYAAGNVFVFASKTETQGLVLLEAMAQATPVVSTAHLGTASILVPGCGARIATDDTAQFAGQVLEVLADPQGARLAGERGRDYARTWSSQAMAAKVVDLYRDVVARTAPRLDPALRTPQQT